MILLTNDEIRKLPAYKGEMSLVQSSNKAQLKKVVEWLRENECAVTTQEYLLFAVSPKDWQELLEAVL